MRDLLRTIFPAIALRRLAVGWSGMALAAAVGLLAGIDQQVLLRAVMVAGLLVGLWASGRGEGGGGEGR